MGTANEFATTATTGLMLGTRVPLVMISRSNSPLARVASVSLAVLATARDD